MNKKVLLIGGTGAIGSYAAEELSNLGFFVDVITLDKLDDSDKIKYYCMEASFESVENFLKDRYYEAIVDFMHHAPDTYLNMLSLLTAHTAQLVFLSSYRVYADKCHPIREDATQLTELFSENELRETKQAYPLEKSLAEQIITNSEYAKKVTIVRPVISFYHDRLSYITLKAPNLVFRSGKKPILVPSEAKNIIAGFCFSGNIGKQIAHLVGKEGAMGEAFTLGISEGLTWGQIAPAFEESLGSNFVWVDADTFLKYTTPDDIGEYYGLWNDRLINRDIDVSKVLSVTGLSASDFVPTCEAIAREAEIILRDKDRYTVGVRADIEENQDRYFGKERLI